MNVIGVAIISVFLGILICLLGIEYNFISVCKPCKQCDPCPKITLQDKILNTFTNTINTRLTKNMLVIDMNEYQNIYFNDYTQFFNTYPEYNKYKLTKEDRLTDNLDNRILFFLFIQDTLNSKIIYEKDKLISTMGIDELLQWIGEKLNMQYYSNRVNIQRLSEMQRSERIMNEFKKIKK